MKPKINYKKIVIAFLFVMIIGSAFIGNFNNVYGEINSEYSQGSNTTGTIDLDKSVSDSSILDYVAHFIYAIANFIEWIVSVLLGLGTGEEVFPWADKVIFNAIPFLDVNFINSSAGSMFTDISNESTIFGNIIKNIYNTIFMLSIAFFGVVVGIMSLRLVMSSIASEKAKYKQAITNWLLALILLFTAHYLMSFVFFINEKMVEVASKILTNTIENEDINLTLDVSALSDESAHSVVSAFFNSVLEDAIKGTTEVDNSIVVNYSGDIDDNYIKCRFKYVDTDTSFNNSKNAEFGMYITDFKFGSINWTSDLTKDDGVTVGINNTKLFERNLAYLLLDESYMDSLGAEFIDFTALEQEAKEVLRGDYGAIDTILRAGKITITKLKEFVTTKPAQILQINTIISDAMALCVFSDEFTSGLKNTLKTNGESPDIININSSSDVRDIIKNRILYPKGFKDISERINSIMSIHGRINTSTSSGDNPSQAIFSDLGQFFKNLVYGIKYDEDGNIVGFTQSKFNPIPAILYSIFVIQSIMYFIAYLKRFFYIVVLAMFAPLIVIYDFLMKSAMG